ncbi:SET domain-containing protein-lysine N-methyltransferase, partial [bacterium M00.F.Ca.ET.228.01.1.1]
PEETYALRDIKPGEELTCDYNHSFENGFDFLGARHPENMVAASVSRASSPACAPDSRSDAAGRP